MGGGAHSISAPATLWGSFCLSNPDSTLSPNRWSPNKRKERRKSDLICLGGGSKGRVSAGREPWDPGAQSMALCVGSLMISTAPPPRPQLALLEQVGAGSCTPALPDPRHPVTPSNFLLMPVLPWGEATTRKYGFSREARERRDAERITAGGFSFLPTWFLGCLLGVCCQRGSRLAFLHQKPCAAG